MVTVPPSKLGQPPLAFFLRGRKKTKGLIHEILQGCDYWFGSRLLYLDRWSYRRNRIDGVDLMLDLMLSEAAAKVAETATFILEGQQWEAEREQRTQHAWMAGRLNAFHHSRRTNTGYQLKRALRSKRYQPNGKKECERRYWQIRMGQLRIDNGKEPYRITRALLDVLEAA